MIQKFSPQTLSRTITASLFIAVIAGTWDVWWHAFLGRESFWSPPHLVLYTAVIVAIVLGIHGWRITKEKMWRNTAALLILIPLSAPFDELWHRTFGIEPINSPLIIWSPPHVMLALSIIGSFFFLLPHLRRDSDASAAQFFTSLALAGSLVLLTLLVSPLEPTSPYALTGFWSAGVQSFAVTFILLSSHRWSQGIGSATIVAAFFIMLTLIGSAGKVNPEIAIAPHDHPPKWLFIFSLLIPASLIDVLQRQSIILKGALVGTLYGGLLYGFSSRYFEPQFQYASSDATVAVISCVIGGLLAGMLVSHYSKHLSPLPLSS